MKLNNIDEMELYIEEEFENEFGEVEVKRVALQDSLEVGQSAYFRNGRQNKIVKHGEDDYMFYRFEEIQTHIDEFDSEYSIEDISTKINSNLEYGLKYADDRVDLVKSLIEENDWIYNLLSSNRVIQKEQKTANCFLSESQTLDRQFEFMADYMVMPKFEDEDSENYFIDIRERYTYLRGKAGKSEREIKEMFDLKDEIDLINQRIVTKSRDARNRQREEQKEDFNGIEAQGAVVETAEFSQEKAKIEYVGRDLVIDEGYWERMGFSEEGARSRREIIDTYNEALDILVKQLGHGEESSVKAEIEANTLASLEEIQYIDDNGVPRKLTPERRLSGLKRMYSELKSDLYRAKEILAVPIGFTQLSPSTTNYDYNHDTWYEDEDGNVVELSKNTVLFSNPNTYKGLITNYYDLKDKYRDDFQDDMWYILLVFEGLLEKTELSIEEVFVLDKIMRDFTRNEVRDEYEKKFGSKVTNFSLSNWINRIIPNKLLETYLDSVNEWLYTYKMKGKFKECRRCNETKTIDNDRYFRRRIDSADGFRNECRECELSAKTAKKRLT